jgi:tetratricopeptide (TPR) repeat protein
MPFGFGEQPASQAVQSPSFVSLQLKNTPDYMERDVLGSANTTDNNNEELDEARQAVTQLSADHPEWLHRSRALTSVLSKRYQETTQDALLAECIGIQRQICTLHNPGDKERAVSVSDLAISLWTRFKQTGEESQLSEAIDLNREALSLRPSGHSDRPKSCSNLANSLYSCFQQTGEESQITEAIDLNREALSLRPSGHPEHSVSCNNLAVSLSWLFLKTGEESLIIEAISLHREALFLRPSGHPERSVSCSNLANSLYIRYKQTGEESLVAEALSLHREALSFRPRGHPERAVSCTNLTASLMARFWEAGEELILAEAIDISREALSLQPRGHPHRSLSCNNLAVSLQARFWKTGEMSLLAEVIKLNREALSLRPGDHPERSMTCSNLAVSLYTCFERTGEEPLLAEAIELNRESLSLRPNGHPERSQSCGNLALSLYIRFKQSGEEPLLDEVIDLYQEELSLEPDGHPGRLETCYKLAASLRARFELTGEESLLVEAIELNKESIKSRPHHHPGRWLAFINLISIYLDRRFSGYNAILAIGYMHQTLCLTSYDWPVLLSEISQLISLIDLPILPSESLFQLLQCLLAAIDLASRVAGFVLNPESQLQYLRNSQHLGPYAYWCAIACGEHQLGLEVTERARAIIWTQALHMRSPQLRDAPMELASELELLLINMNKSRTYGLLSPTEQDVRYRDGARIHQLIQQIRAMPGHEGFMHGLTFNELVQCASRNAVVILVAAEGECHALILRPNGQESVTLKLLNSTPDELAAMSIIASAPQRRGSPPDHIRDRRIGMNVSSKTHSDLILNRLWATVVKPVIEHLHIQVRVASQFDYHVTVAKTQTESFEAIATTSPLVPDRCFHSPSFTCCRHI